MMHWEVCNITYTLVFFKMFNLNIILNKLLENSRMWDTLHDRHDLDSENINVIKKKQNTGNKNSKELFKIKRN